MAGVSIPEPIRHRHPELVSGPISRFVRSKRRQTQSHSQIRPMRVVLVNEVDLPRPVPALQLLFPQDRRFHFAEQFEMNKRVDGVARSEARHSIVAMLPKPRDEVGGDADIDRAVGLAREDVDARLPLFPHGLERGAQWVLKQVQDDENCEVEQIPPAKNCLIASTFPSFPVTLNSFQGLSCHKRGTLEPATEPTALRVTERSGWAEKWVLKQVEDDENCEVVQ